MLHPFGIDQTVGEVFYLFGFASNDNHFQAVVVIEMIDCRGGIHAGNPLSRQNKENCSPLSSGRVGSFSKGMKNTPMFTFDIVSVFW